MFCNYGRERAAETTCRLGRKMLREAETEVLVVGAGPVGMTTALLLAEQGVKSTVIDTAEGTAAHSYACALHSRSLELLDRFGLVGEILEWGHRIDSVAFYDGSAKRAEVRLSELATRFPFVVVLPQNALEMLLERTLNRRAGIQVHWRNRLTDLKFNHDSVVGTVVELPNPRTIGSSRSSEKSPDEKIEIRAPFLVGADGHHSLVRRCLGVYYEQVGEPEQFAVFEFETDATLNDEVSVVLDDQTTNVLWPISDRRCRWSFQLKPEELAREFPLKERRVPGPVNGEEHSRLQTQLQAFFQARAPWFKGTARRFNWVQSVRFERRLTKHFTIRRCWLIGDAAHQTSPVGVQSFNVGLTEADELVAALRNVFRDPERKVSEAWNQRWREEWQHLLGLKGSLKTLDTADNWVKQRASRMLPCFPASGDHLSELLTQLQLTYP